MTKKEQQPIYVSPKVTTIEIKAQAIICQSGQSFGLGNDTYSSGDSEDPWNE